jgi:S-adenosylmethionine-diacylglycerol 3-amino-3-carboxypropyl transferase
MTEQRLQVLEGRLNYAQCWEDPAVLQGALRVGPDDDVLSICSAGDNSFALAIAGANSVTCVDLSVPQLALAELKLRAAEALPVQSFRSLLGLDPGGRRIWFYHHVRPLLSHRARAWFDENESLVREGIVFQGRFERYLATFSTRILPLIHDRDTVRRLLAQGDSVPQYGAPQDGAPPDADHPGPNRLDAGREGAGAQRRFYENVWDTWRWRALFRVFFSEAVMARRGRSKEQFAFVDGPVSSAFLERVAHGLRDLPISDNYFLSWYLRSSFADLENAHPYLSTAGHKALAGAGDRIRFIAADVESYLRACDPGSFSAFNFSNIFEYLDADTHRRILELTVRAARPGARICYWNLLVPRWRPDDMAHLIDRDEPLGARLLAQDRALVYGAVQVEVVR